MIEAGNLVLGHLSIIQLVDLIMLRSCCVCFANVFHYLLLFVLNFAVSQPGSSPLFNIPSAAAPPRKTGPDDFLNSDGEKNDYDW